MKKRYKKATLSISIGAIVIIVIAFVVLGLGLVLTKTIFKRATAEIPEIFEVAKLGREPTAEAPLTIRKEISIKRGSTKQLDVGYYNRDRDQHEDVVIDILNCLSVATGAAVNESDIPLITSLAQDIESGTPIGYLIYLKEERKLDSGEYVCEVVAVTEGEDPYERVQVSLTVTT